jgi:hypothetical protein
MRRRNVFAVPLLLLAAGAVRGDDVEAARTFRRAELEETAFGRLEEAARRFHDAAAAATSAALRTKATLREGACLLRLGRREDAKALLTPLTAADDVAEDVRRAAKAELARADVVAPPTGRPASEVVADPGRLSLLEREVEDTRTQLEDALKRAERLDKRTEELKKTTEDLAQKLREKDSALRVLQAEVAPASAEEALKIRILQEEERRRRDRDISRNYTNFARQRHQDGDFTQARDFLYAAIEKDRENAEAKALLRLVSAPLSDRERLYEEIRGVLALANEVRGARTAAEIDALVGEGRRRQERGEYAASVAPLERAIALVDEGSAYLRDPDAAREGALSLLTTAQTHGAQRVPVPHVEPADDTEGKALAAVRGLLASAGSEVVRGLDLRFHDVDAILGASATGLAPAAVGAAPLGWTVSNDTSEGEGVDGVAQLLVAYLRAMEIESFAAPGASLEPEGSTLIAVCDAASQSRLADRLARLLDVTAPAADVRVSAWRATPGEFAAALDRRHIRPHAVGDGAHAATVPGSELDAIAAELGTRLETWPSVAALRATPLRAFRLVAGTSPSTVAIDVLPVTRPSQGVGVRIATTTAPAGRRDGAQLRQVATTGAGLDPGAALVVWGLADPADPAHDLVVTVRLGAAAAPAASASSALSTPGLSASEMLLPEQVRDLTEIGPLPSELPGPPLPTREQAIASRVRAVAKSATLVEVKDDRVRVVGPEDARVAARRFLDQADVVRGLQSFDVRLHHIDAVREQEIARAAPKFMPVASGAFSSAVLKGEERRNVERILEAAGGRVPTLESRIGAPSTGLATLVRLVRSSYRSRVEPTPGEPRWGTTETSVADQGLLVALRPFGRTTSGRVDLDLAMRAVWIRDRGERRRDTSVGAVTWMEPAFTGWSDQVAVQLSDEEALVLAGMASPLATGGERDRLVVVVTNAPPR